ncbi:hypothetical protein Tco_0808357, partial [Tanacetum coccineum]
MEIGKCNGRINPGKTQREPTFQVVLDALALTPCYSAFLTTADVPEICLGVPGQDFDELPTDNDIVSFFKEMGHTEEIKSITDVVFDQMHQPWRTFATIINRSLSRKITGLDKLRLSRAQILWGMYYKKNVDYVELLWEDFTYQIDNRGVTPPKKARKFKKPASPKLTIVPVSHEEPTRKDTPVMSLFKKKEKVTIEKRKGIELLFEVALTKKAQFEEVRKKSLRDYHKTHPSGSGIVTKIAASAAKIKPSITNKGTGMDEDDRNNDHDSSSEGSDQESENGDDNIQSDNEKGSDSEHETDENETGSESDQEENEEKVEDDEEEKEDESVKTLSNYTSTNNEDETNVESKVENKAEGDEDKGMDYTTNQFDDDVDVRLNEPVNTDEGFIQKEGTDAEMINVQQRNENPETTINQVIEDAHVTIPSNQTPTLLTVPITVITESSPVYTTTILQSLPSSTPPPPQSTPTPPPTTKATNPLSTLLNFASVFLFNNRFTTLEKEVSELRKDHLLNNRFTALVDEHLDSMLGATRDEFMSYLSACITARITNQVKIQLPQILPKEVSNFAPPVIRSMVTELLEHAALAKESSQPQSTYEAAASLIKFELKKILIDKMEESQSYLTATEHKECYDGLIKSYDLDKSLFSTYDKVYLLKRSRKDKDKDEDPSAGSDQGLKKRKTRKDSVHAEEQVADSDMPQDQEENLGNDDEEPKRKVASKRVWFTKPKQPQEPNDSDWNVGKTPQQGPTQSWLMTLAATTDKPSKTCDELKSTPIDFSAYIMNGLNITNLTQETLFGPAFKL